MNVHIIRDQGRVGAMPSMSYVLCTCGHEAYGFAAGAANRAHNDHVTAAITANRATAKASA